MTLPRDIEGVRVLAEKLAREHAATGGKVVGYVTPCVPAELIEAAGMRPIMLSAGNETSTALGDRVMEDLFDTSIRGIFERLLKGEFEFLSAIVLPRANDSAHRLYYYLSELKRTGEVKLPPVLLCDVVMTPDAASRQYSIDALGRLWKELRSLGKVNADETDLALALSKSNVRNMALAGFIEVRRKGATPAADVLAAFAAARMLPLEVFAEQFSELPPAETRQRVIICGSAHDDAKLHGLVEAAGGAVVGDYHSGGELSVGRVLSNGPALEVLADSLRADPGATRRVADPATHIVAFAQTCGAETAIFSYFPEEEALTWDYPEQKAALEARGIRVLRLAEQTRPFDVAVNRSEVEAFIRGAAK
jgi:benzoyl-CoA reductase/2-hydroxyglutaryl-CoA dehydratase subunit BcrC/BadD/HgdB